MQELAVKIWLLTGEPGIGKSSVLMKAVNLLKTRGYRVGGVYSREVRQGGGRVGFEMVDASTGEKDILASSTLSAGPRVGRYRVNLKGLAELGAKALMNAVDVAEIVVCDEIGPMELFSPEFRRAIKAVSASGKPVIGVIHKRAKDPLVEELKSSPSVEILEVTYENRSDLPTRLAEKVFTVMDEG